LEQRLIQKNLAKYLPERKILVAKNYSEKFGQIFTRTQNIWNKDLFRKIWLNVYQNEKLFRKFWLNMYQNAKYLEQRLVQKNLAKYLPERKILV
jgi:hypothetical protein